MLKGQGYGTAIVLDEQPVTLLQAVTIDGQRFILSSICDHERDELLRKLERPVVIGAAENNSRDAVSVGVGRDKVVGRCFAGGIRAARVKVSFFSEALTIRCTSVDLVGTN